MSATKLFTPITLGGKNPIKLLHRVVMAPLTRLRAGPNGEQPDIAATYYRQRATAGGLIVSEAANISATARGYFGSPGLFTQGQVEAWKPVTAAVHDKQGVIFAQLWHTGRIGHRANQPDNQPAVSSTSAYPDALSKVKVPVPDGRDFATAPRALRADEIPAICQDYQNAAVNALKAGFDGVELHSANGYLLEQFLYDEINDRTDEYGGSIENRARFLFQALDAIVAKVDSSRVGIRLSPFSVACGQKLSHPVEDSTYILKKLATYDLAYVHVIEPRGRHGTGPLAPPEGITPLLRKVYPGVLITASDYQAENAKQVVDEGNADLVAVGRPFIANPDLVERFRVGAKLNPWNEKTFYADRGAADPNGYIDYPFLNEA